MKNTFKIIGIIALVAVIGFSFAACDNGNKEGILRLQNIDTTGSGYGHGVIVSVDIYEWGTSDRIESAGNINIDRDNRKDFTLSEGEYRIELHSRVYRGAGVGSYTREYIRTSNKIIIAKGTTVVVYYDPWDGTFLY
jgi:hypothetical protein